MQWPSGSKWKLQLFKSFDISKNNITDLETGTWKPKMLFENLCFNRFRFSTCTSRLWRSFRWRLPVLRCRSAVKHSCVWRSWFRARETVTTSTLHSSDSHNQVSTDLYTIDSSLKSVMFFHRIEITWWLVELLRSGARENKKCASLRYLQGFHSTWKTWKNHGNIKEFCQSGEVRTLYLLWHTNPKYC